MSITIFQQARLPRGLPAREVDLASIVADQRFNGLLRAADKAGHACLGAFFDLLQITMGLAVRMLIVSGLALVTFLFIAVSERSKAAI